MTMARIEPFHEDSTTGFLHVPSDPLNRAVVLTHGAGGNCQAPLLVAIATEFSAAGFHVLRCDLRFRQRRRFGPPSPAQAADDRDGLRAAIASVRSRVAGPLLLAGHSYGGRQASILASEDASVCDALLLLSYPLHPPHKPSQLRTAHFPALTTPCLFVHGTKDPFGTIDELQTAMELISAPAQLSVVDNAGHDLRRGQFDISAAIMNRLPSLGLQ